MSNSSNCNYRKAPITPAMGLFHGILFFPTNCEFLAAFHLSGWPILCKLSWYAVRTKWPMLLWIFKKSLKNYCQECIFFLWKGLIICSVFTGENAFKHFLFINTVLQSSGSFYFSDTWKSNPLRIKESLYITWLKTILNKQKQYQYITSLSF